ncbi:hypothetical protein J6590_009305 [Homalodisca vitripennis]|nr:hypothetical protein J6590_009305 [Homalodisca vitripennis]
MALVIPYTSLGMITLDDLAYDLRSGELRLERLLAPSAGFGGPAFLAKKVKTSLEIVPKFQFQITIAFVNFNIVITSDVFMMDDLI